MGDYSPFCTRMWYIVLQSRWSTALPIAFVYLICLIPLGLARFLLPEADGLLVALVKICFAGIVFWGLLDFWRLRPKRS